jgi:hypothetical protein
MANPRAKKYFIGGLFYFLVFAGVGTETIGGSDSDDKCGGKERWAIKVLSDPSANTINETPRDTTLAGLSKINTQTGANKYKEMKPRMAIESQVYRIKNCFITKVLIENDNDLHLVIEDGKKNTMIAEIPDPSCLDAMNSPFINSFIETRQTMQRYANNYRHYMFTITGVLFVDRSHGQTGKSPNNIEIHPILEIKKEKKINPILQ